MPYTTLFGRGFRLGQMPVKPLEAQPMGDKSQAGQRAVNSAAGGSATPGSAGGGWRGAFMRKNLPRTLQIIGAAMQDINGSGNLAAFQGNEAEQQRQAAIEMARSREGKLEDQQQGYFDQAIGSLPAEQQPWARLAPDAAARSVFARQAQPDYELDANGRPYTIQGGQVQYGQGQVAVQRPGTDRAPPAGYQWTPEGNLQAIQGGPADIRATTEGRMRLQQTDSSIRQLDNAISSLPDNINNSAAGFWGGMTRSVPGSSAYDLNQTLEPVRAILSFENLQEMRRNSATGGALGSIAVRELELLGKPSFPKERFIDTLVLAREHRPGSPASLDAVCQADPHHVEQAVEASDDSRVELLVGAHVRHQPGQCGLSGSNWVLGAFAGRSFAARGTDGGLRRCGRRD